MLEVRPYVPFKIFPWVRLSTSYFLPTLPCFVAFFLLLRPDNCYYTSRSRINWEKLTTLKIMVTILRSSFSSAAGKFFKLLVLVIHIFVTLYLNLSRRDTRPTTKQQKQIYFSSHGLLSTAYDPRSLPCLAYQ